MNALIQEYITNQKTLKRLRRVVTLFKSVSGGDYSDAIYNILHQYTKMKEHYNVFIALENIVKDFVKDFVIMK